MLVLVLIKKSSGIIARSGVFFLFVSTEFGFVPNDMNCLVNFCCVARSVKNYNPYSNFLVL